MSGNPKVPDRLNNGLNISLGILCKREGVQIQLTYILYLYMAIRKSYPIVQNKLVYAILMCVYCFFQAECQNHIRIVVKLSEELLLLCGTHAYKPKCRHYTFKVCYFWYKSST